jgi:hypothetical protein
MALGILALPKLSGASPSTCKKIPITTYGSVRLHCTYRYHINDYHGAVAPLHLLPRVIPCCLSLHNAEFQGLWPMRTPVEMDEVCRIYNLDPDVVKQYVQFGEVFNLLHAGASYLRVWQKGFGAAGEL